MAVYCINNLFSGNHIFEVITVMKYSNLSELLIFDKNAKKYFNSLPDYTRQHIFLQFGRINSFESLKAHAENLYIYNY